MEQGTARYYLGENDRSGVLLGLTMHQTVIVGCGMAVMLMLRLSGVRFTVTLVPVACAALLAKARWRGRWVYDWVGVLARWAHRQNKTSWWTETPWDGTQGEPPRAFTGISITCETLGSSSAAVIWDSAERTAAAVLEIRGRDFELLEPQEQDGVLADFGRSLGLFVQEGTPVVRLSWHEVAFRQSLDRHRRFVRDAGSGVDPAQRRAYLALVDEVGASTTRHRVYLSVVVGQLGVDRSAKHGFGTVGRTSDERMLAALDKALSALARRLTDSGIEVAQRLDVDALRNVLSEAIDPSTALGLAPQAGRLSDRMGTSGRMGPMEVEEAFNWLCTDGTFHRSYRIASWPRTAQPGDWLVKVLSRPESARTMAVTFEPVSPLKSQRQIERALARLDADSTVREESGRRVSFAAVRARADVLQREEELVSGFGEVRYWSVVTVSATSVEALVEACEEWESTAGSAGIVLSPCDGEQEAAWAASLPLSVGAMTARLTL